MDVGQREIMTVQYSRTRTGVVIGNGIRKDVAKKLPEMSFILWVFRELLPRHMNEDGVRNNCAKYFILSSVGYPKSAFDKVLDVGLNRKSAMERGEEVVGMNATWMQTWAEIEELTK